MQDENRDKADKKEAGQKKKKEGKERLKEGEESRDNYAEVSFVI